MGLAVAHVLGTIILLDLVRHYITGKQGFPRYLLVVGGVAALAPDLDIPLSWLLSFFAQDYVNLHRIFTHSFSFAVLFGIVALVLYLKKDMKWSKIFVAIAVGWSMHILMDCFYGGFLPMTWPFNFITSCPSWGLTNHSHSIDAILLVAWIVHEEIHNKIKDYI